MYCMETDLFALRSIIERSGCSKSWLALVQQQLVGVALVAGLAERLADDGCAHEPAGELVSHGLN